MKELPFERAAMNNEPMPDGLDYVDCIMYQGLTYLYLRYHTNGITRERAREEKGKMLYWYNVRKNQKKYEDNMYRFHAGLMKSAEGAANAYAKDRTLENADRLYQAVYGSMPFGSK